MLLLRACARSYEGRTSRAAKRAYTDLMSPCNTAQMGHWAEGRLPELKKQLGLSGDEHDAALLALTRWAQSDTELLVGHRFEGEQRGLRIHFGGLPFAPTLDLQTATLGVPAEVWPIADPVHPEFSNVLQVARFADPPSRAVSKAEALSAAAAVLAAVHRDGWLSLAPLVWFVEQGKSRPVEFGRELLDPKRHVHVPVAWGTVEGWWFQVSRRIFFVTKEAPDEPGLVELLAPPVDGLVLAASEPILIVARMTEHPSDWAFVARVWAAEGTVLRPRPWRSESQAVHAHGLPILCLDGQSTPQEVVAQILLVAYWHGYLEGEETALIPRALASAFPRDVDRLRLGTGSSDAEAAAALLFERLLRPGFDPTRGAGSIRRYIARHATTLVKDHLSAQAEFHHWNEIGISQRRYYKLLARFAEKGLDDRYEVNEAVLASVRDYLNGRQRRADSMEWLRSLGFGDAAARKWLQRHDLSEIATAKPRRPRVG